MEEDELLINRYLEGDQISLKTLIDKYTSSVYNFTQRFKPKRSGFFPSSFSHTPPHRKETAPGI